MVGAALVRVTADAGAKVTVVAVVARPAGPQLVGLVAAVRSTLKLDHPVAGLLHVTVTTDAPAGHKAA